MMTDSFRRFRFPLQMWLFSRLLIILSLLIIAPLLPEPPGGIKAVFGWDVFAAWDSEHYQHIATFGYGDSKDSAYFAFFPLFPLIIHLLMSLGLPFNVAGTLINNLAFLTALIIFYNWLQAKNGETVARWATAILAWCPFSLFGTVIYTEGLFLLFSITALKSFDNQNYILATISGILATATRVTGLALIPAFWLTAWQEKRSINAYLVGLFSSLGIALYSLYCWVTVKEPLAFIWAQKHWQPEQDFWGQSWLKMLAQIVIGSVNWKAGTIIDIWHPLLFIIISSLIYFLWQYYRREKLTRFPSGWLSLTHSQSLKWGKIVDYGICFLIFLLWILAGNPLINTAMVLGGGYVLWRERTNLANIAVNYGLFSLGIIFSSGRTASAERYAYGIVSISMALGVLLAKYPRWGYCLVVFFGLLLGLYAIRFAQHLWVA